MASPFVITSYSIHYTKLYEQVIAVGDGSNDLPMIQLAGLGIAFHAKPKVKASAKNSISEIGLDAILYLIGFRDREIND